MLGRQRALLFKAVGELVASVILYRSASSSTSCRSHSTGCRVQASANRRADSVRTLCVWMKIWASNTVLRIPKLYKKVGLARSRAAALDGLMNRERERGAATSRHSYTSAYIALECTDLLPRIAVCMNGGKWFSFVRFSLTRAACVALRSRSRLYTCIYHASQHSLTRSHRFAHFAVLYIT